MESVRYLRGITHPYTAPARYFLLLTFYCDESHDLYPHSTYVFAGFLSDEQTWMGIEQAWKHINKEYAVSRFHASHLNARSYEYAGWSKERQIGYSDALLKSLEVPVRVGTLLGISTTLYADRYREILDASEQEKCGSPHQVCYKTCLAIAARTMDRFPDGWKVATVFDRQREHRYEAQDAHWKMRESTTFPYANRLAGCDEDGPDQIGLQVADMLAYETFRFTRDPRNGNDSIRPVMQRISEISTLEQRVIGEQTLLRLKPLIAAAKVEPNGFIIMPGGVIQ